MLHKSFSQVARVSERYLRKTSALMLLKRCALVLSLAALFCFSGCGRNDTTMAQQERTRRVAGDAGTTGKANENKKSEMSKHEKNAGPTSFYPALEQALSNRSTTLAAVCDTKDPVSKRVLEDYGAMFVASDSVLPPPVCVFKSEAEVLKFHNDAKFSSAKIGGASIELQPAAMSALQEARREAIEAGLNITPRGGTEAARRSYDDTRRLWDTRFLPALAHWQQKGRLSKEKAAHLRALPLDQQVAEVLELEKKGIFFSKDLSKSILYSIAAPGTSQHIAMLALDVSQFADGRVRRILARHGWFQTVKSDLPHFTFLGVAEETLPRLGLRAVMSGEQKFWIPNVNE